jgi:hypothetical protein
MKYEFNNKVINIPDNEIKSNMDLLDISKTEAIEMWLDDNDYTTNDEQKELDEKAKKVKIQHGASAIDKTQKRDKKPRTVKISDEKKLLFDYISTSLGEFCTENNAKVEILTQNKIIAVKIGDKYFKLDLIQARKPLF